jgi:hypothetical protein
MPSIAEFLGMWITINWSDHNPPHFHVKAGGCVATVTIKEAKVLSGSLPPSKLKYLRKWVTLHRGELMENWQLAQENKPLKKIQGL